MSRLSELHDKEYQAKAQILKLKADKVTAENEVYENPASDEAAMKAVALEMQIKAAEKAAEKAAKAIEDENARLESKEYKDAQKQLKELEKQAAAIQERNITWARGFFPEYETWEAIIREHQTLARQHDIDVLDLFSRDAMEAGMRTIKEGLDGWDAQRRRIDYRERHHPAGG